MRAYNCVVLYLCNKSDVFSLVRRVSNLMLPKFMYILEDDKTR